MRTRLLQVWRMAAGVVVMPLLVGCVEDSSADAVNDLAPTNSFVAANIAVAAAADDGMAVEDSENAPPPERAEPAPGSDTKPVPADLKLSPATREIVRLAHGGVDSSVMLAFITNSTGTFSLGSDQIVYLNDLGVASEAIASMIEHDRLLREGQGALPPIAIAAAPPAAQPAIFDASTAAPQALPVSEEAAAPPPEPVAEAVPAPPASVTYNYFHDSLSPYGSWVDVEGYGYCWQPTVVVANPGWQPYCHGGRWIYSDYGWYWHSDYSWGWAPFHYGRWFTHPRWGWCWYPDTVWGPSWVSWRYTDAYCGWAPLPPAACYTSGLGFSYYGSSVGVSFGFGLGWGCYSYVPWDHFHGHRGHHYEKHRPPPHHAREIHRQSRPVNDVVAGRHNTPINRGIGEERVRQYTKSELRPARVREETLVGHNSRLAPGDRLERGGRELVIRRPPLPQTPAEPKQARTTRPETRAVSTIPSGERRSPLDLRDARASTPPKSSGATVDVPPHARPGAPTGNLTRRDAPTPEAARDGTPRAPGVSPSRPSGDIAKRPPSPGPAALPSMPSAPPRPESSATKRERPSPGTVTSIGRRGTPPANPGNSSNGGAVPRSPQPSSPANPAITWTRPAESRANLALNSPQNVPTPPPPTRTPAPTVQKPALPVSPGTARQEPPRIQSAPAPAMRSEPRLSAPPAPSSPPNVVRFPSTPSHSAPPPRPSPGPSQNFAPRATPTPAPAAPAPRSSPAPSFSPAPGPSAPGAAPAPSVPRSAPSPPPSNSGSSGRSGGGRSGQPR